MVRAAKQRPVAADGQDVNPIAGDQTMGVEVRGALVKLGVPGVLDREVGIGTVRVAFLASAFRLGAQIERLGEGVAGVDRQAVRGRVAQAL